MTAAMEMLPAQAPVVMIVDDDPTTRLLAQTFLGDSGFEVIDCEDGEQALARVDPVRPDLILLDVEMPGISGFDVCRRLRADERWWALPIMMLTGREDLESVQRAFAAGATDFTPKPVNWPVLAHRLRYLLRGAETVRELDQAQRSSALGSWSCLEDSEVMRWSAHLYAVLGLTVDDEAATWAGFECAVPAHEHARIRAAWTRALCGEPVDITHQVVRPSDGASRVVRHRFECVPAHGERRAVLHGTVQDITERYQAERKVRRLAYYDSLTGLPNRAAFQESLERGLARAGRESSHLAVLYLDIDDFKRVNDTLGHAAGDALLAEAAVRLRRALRGGDTIGLLDPADDGEGPVDVARLGGDEFALILEGLADAPAAATVSARIIEAFTDAFALDAETVFVTPSIGVACHPQDGVDAESLLKHADAAMYEAKRSGKNAVHFHDRELSEAAERRTRLEMALRKALDRDELSIVYQPQYRVGSGSLASAEALLRWSSPELGAISPGEFIPIAEASGLIVPIGDWVLRTACEQLVSWQRDGYGFERVAVNVSVKQFLREDFVGKVSSVIADTGCKPASLELEITESVLASDADGAIGVLHSLKRLGVQLSIDDFGTGYSSLSYLKRFPIDRLKIDRSFVRDIDTDPNDAAITSAVIGIARGMGIAVLAEGVETASQLELLESKGCDEIQGYYISMPLPPSELLQSLAVDTRFGHRPAIPASGSGTVRETADG